MANLSVLTAKPESVSRRAGASTAHYTPLWLLILVAMVLGLILSYSRFLSVWQHGTFFDSDDAMRLVQVRNLLHGQAWFNMTVARLDPPHGVFMHWSRVVDVPLALLIKLFSVVLPRDLAERATRLVFPLGLQVLLYIGVAQLAKSLMGRAAVLPAVLFTLLSGMQFGQFQPGRIDHHSAQIVLTIFMLASLVDAIDPAKARRAALAGALAALSLAISIETLPFIVMLAGLCVVLWVIRGAEMRRALAYFGAGLGLAMPLTFVATVGPGHWFMPVCDAYSPTYLVPGFVGATVILGLAAASPRLPNWPSRLAVAGLAGGVAVGAAFAIKPVCFINPFDGLDPLVRRLWLDNVVEAMSLRRFLTQSPGTALILFIPVALGLCGAIVAFFREDGLQKLRWFVVAAMGIVGLALSCWMIRVVTFARPIVLLGGVWCVLALRDVLARTKWREVAMLSFCLVLPFSAVGWAFVIPTRPHGADWRKGTGCLASSAFAPLAKLAPGIVAAPIDAGSHILAFTPLSVLAGPYHRNNIGNHAELAAMLATPHKAQEILSAHDVTYVMTCASLGETAALAKRAPHGLAAALLSGDVPTWLQRLPEPGPYNVFVMQR